MSYHLYQTRGFVLRSANIGEANKLFFIFTENMGLLGVSAQSVRKITSKLRYSLRDFSFARISLIRGKTSWRLTDAEEIFSFSFEKETEKLKVFAGILSLVRRLVHGEEDNPKLFSLLLETLDFLKGETLDSDELKRLETLAVLKVLASLGYVGESKILASFITASFSKNILNAFESVRRDALREVNRALQESQL
ncbi:MAG: DNA repair protein RecO [Candidatus Parcubacteria bacterium]|nr:DNA repair protein RecO [Candidatus Parcubacteria bacterium]